MPGTFPEMWENRVRTQLTAQDAVPTWAQGLSELTADVQVVNAGTPSEQNIIHLPTTIYRPGMLIDNTTYPIPTVAYTDDFVSVRLRKYQTKVSSISDDEANGSSYDKIDPVTKSHREEIVESKWGVAAHTMAPASNTTDTPVIEATGAADASGRPKLKWADVITARRKRGKGVKKTGWRLVLCPDHVNDLLEDETAGYSRALANWQSGQAVSQIAGFQIHEFDFNPYYVVATKARLAYDGIVTSAHRQCSFIFNEENVAAKTGNTKQYFAPSGTDPEYQTNRLNYRHYHVMMPIWAKYAVAII